MTVLSPIASSFPWSIKERFAGSLERQQHDCD
jgi:hypothetical protein